MPGPISKQSRDLANVRLQLKSGKTRGSNPRPLSPEEVCALEARRDQLHSEMAGRRRRRSKTDETSDDGRGLVSSSSSFSSSSFPRARES